MKIVLIGHGMVGHKFLESLAETCLSHVEVTVLCEEPRPAYDRVHLSEFFAGKSAEDLSLVEPGFFERTGFSLRLAAQAVHGVARGKRLVGLVDHHQAGGGGNDFFDHRVVPAAACAHAAHLRGLAAIDHQHPIELYAPAW